MESSAFHFSLLVKIIKADDPTCSTHVVICSVLILFFLQGVECASMLILVTSKRQCWQSSPASSSIELSSNFCAHEPASALSNIHPAHQLPLQQSIALK